MRLRPPAELRLLLDAARTSIAVGALLVLSQTWWVDYDLDGDISTSGWGGLDDTTLGQGWFLLSHGDGFDHHMASGIGIGLGMIAATGIVQAVAAFAPTPGLERDADQGTP